MKIFRSYSSRETADFAHQLAQAVIAKKFKGAAVITLRGDLGAGKTTFVQGFARGLGVRRKISSPTFVIMRRFTLPRSKKIRNLYHIDAYRIKKSDALDVLGLKEVLADPQAVVLVEWPEKLGNIFPRDAVRISFEHGKKENERVISLSL